MIAGWNPFLFSKHRFYTNKYRFSPDIGATLVRGQGHLERPEKEGGRKQRESDTPCIPCDTLFLFLSHFQLSLVVSFSLNHRSHRHTNGRVSEAGGTSRFRSRSHFPVACNGGIPLLRRRHLIQGCHSLPGGGTIFLFLFFFLVDLILVRACKDFERGSRRWEFFLWRSPPLRAKN